MRRERSGVAPLPIPRSSPPPGCSGARPPDQAGGRNTWRELLLGTTFGLRESKLRGRHQVKTELFTAPSSGRPAVRPGHRGERASFEDGGGMSRPFRSRAGGQIREPEKVAPPVSVGAGSFGSGARARLGRLPAVLLGLRATEKKGRRTSPPAWTCLTLRSGSDYGSWI